MELVSAFGLKLWASAAYILPFLAVLTLVVFVHEFGHFIVGRWRGVGITAFSIGFGPEIAGFNDRHGTRWKFCAIPLGGYVKFVGDANPTSAAPIPQDQLAPSERGRSLNAQPVAGRAAIVAAGPIANFLLAIAIFTGTAYFLGKPVLTPRIETVAPGSAAEAAGFLKGDVVRAVDGRPIASFAELQREVSGRAGAAVVVRVERAGRDLDLTATPRLVEEKTKFGTQRRGVLGLVATSDPSEFKVVSLGLVDAFRTGLGETWFVVERTGAYLGGLFAGRESTDQLTGPIGLARVSAHVADNGLVALLSLAGLLSVSIGLLNLLPVPMLDGGHLLFYAAEALRGRPLSERTQELGFRVGLALVLALMVFVTLNDIWQIRAS